MVNNPSIDSFFGNVILGSFILAIALFELKMIAMVSLIMEVVEVS